MKSLLSKGNIVVPKFQVIDKSKVKNEEYLSQLQNTLGLPFILKPCSESNSRNITLVKTIEEFPKNILNDNLTYQAEEFINGKVFFCDTLHINGSSFPIMISEYINPPLNFANGLPHGSRTLSFNNNLSKKILSFNEKVLSLMPQVDNTITHLEFFMSNDELIFLEIAARAPGAYVAKIGEFHQGINFEELNFRIQLDLPWQLPEKPISHAAWVWFPKRKGKVVSLNPPELSCKNNFEYIVNVNDNLKNIDQGVANCPKNAVSTVILWDEEESKVKKDFDILREFTSVILEH